MDLLRQALGLIIQKRQAQGQTWKVELRIGDFYGPKLRPSRLGQAAQQFRASPGSACGRCFPECKI